MKNIFSLFFSMLAFNLHSSPLPPLPDSLLKNANAVVISQKLVYDIKGLSKAITSEQKKVLIINEAGYKQAITSCMYDKFNELRLFRGSIQDLSGNEIRNISQDEIKDVSMDGSSLSTESRMKYIELAYTKYPFILSTEYEIGHKSLLFFPIWVPQEDYNMAILSSEFSIYAPPTMEIRYKMQQANNPRISTTEDGKKRYFWREVNRCVLKKEDYSPHFFQLVPIVYTAGSEFQIGEYKGQMNAWEDIGKWYYQMNDGRTDISPALAENVQNLIQNVTDTKEKVKIIYEFMQSRTRYVSIQLGIGGWQTAPALEVETKGYGDCKALSNFMKALLKAAHIDAYQALIKAGRHTPPFLADFPNVRFNHVILCVPLEKDTIWLECTSQREMAGYLGTFTDDRYALIIHPEGGKLVKTPAYLPINNLKNRNITLTINENGNAIAQISTIYQAQMRDLQGVSEVVFETKEKQKEWILENTMYENSEVDSFAFTTETIKLPTIKLKTKSRITNFCAKSGKRMFLAPLSIAAISKKMNEMETRINPISIDYGFIFSDTIRIQMPNGYKVETLLKNIDIKQEFGTYTAICKEENGYITCIRSLQLLKGVYEKDTYPLWTTFWKDITKNDKSKIVLVIE